MVLLDHFRPPLSTKRHWHSFHNAWSTYLSEDLNQVLPEGYFAEPNAQFGIEIDVAAFSEKMPVLSTGQPEASEWTPQAPTATLPFQPTTDVVEVQIFSTQSGPTLVGAIELVSPANKDRPSQRDAFASKCQTYLQQGIGLVVVDVVTPLNANLHNELMSRLNLPIQPLSAELYAIAYRIAEANQTSHLELWQEKLTVGAGLPTRLCLATEQKTTLRLKALPSMSFSPSFWRTHRGLNGRKPCLSWFSATSKRYLP